MFQCMNLHVYYNFYSIFVSVSEVILLSAPIVLYFSACLLNKSCFFAEFIVLDCFARFFCNSRLFAVSLTFFFF